MTAIRHPRDYYRPPPSDRPDAERQRLASIARGSARNEPCGCGSGKKAKKCHPDGRR